MADCRVRFYPIPKVNPIPPNVVGLIGGIVGQCPTFVLSLRGKEIVVQAATDPESGSLGSRSDFDESNPFYDWYIAERSLKIYAHYLEIIQSLLAGIEFGNTNWAYLTYNQRKGYQITQKTRRMPRPTCSPWGPLIHESELEYTVYGLAGDRRGIWNGKEVDIMVGWDECHMADVDRAMYGYRLLAGLDLTFEFYGHLVGCDGEIKGIVSEAAWGRMVTAEDFTRVYKAVSRVQRRGLLYKAVLTNRFMVANNRVRLLDLSMVDASLVSQPEELEKEAERWHWGELTQLFHEIRTIGPYGDYRIPFHRFVTSHEDLQCLPFAPSPEFPLGGIMLYPDFFRNFYVDPWPEYADIWEDLEEEEKKEGDSKEIEVYRRGPSTLPNMHRSTSFVIPMLRLGGSHNLPVSRPQNRQSRRMTYYPYTLPKHKRLLSGDTSTESDAGPSL